MGRATPSGRDTGGSLAEGESLFPSHQQLPTQNGASALSALGAGSLHSCRPRRLLSQGVLFLQLSISHGLRLSFSSPESSETIIHCSAGFNCWANDPQPGKTSCPLIVTSAWQLSSLHISYRKPDSLCSSLFASLGVLGVI